MFVITKAAEIQINSDEPLADHSITVTTAYNFITKLYLLNDSFVDRFDQKIISIPRFTHLTKARLFAIT